MSRRLGVRGAVVHGTYVAGDVSVDCDRVEAVGLAGSGRGIAVPGFVDVQVNGYAGVDFLAADADGWHAAAAALAADGVAAFLPTLITAPPDHVRRALQVAQAAAATQPAGTARILGVHLEGPFLSPAKPGTHPPEHLLAPDTQLALDWAASGVVRLVTLAPELPGALELMRSLTERGVTVSLGHSDATAAEAHAGFAAGARCVTHLFNAMPVITSRSPGLAGAALADPRVGVPLICDRVHLADDLVRLVLAAAPDRLVLVTDAIAATGVGDGTESLGSVAVRVRGMEARRSDGTLAGSVLTMPAAVRNLVELGASLELAAEAASRRPAALVGHAADLAPGSPADVAILDDSLAVHGVLRAGKAVEPGPQER